MPYTPAPLSVRCFRYGLVTEQRKGTIRYFADLGDRMLPANSRTDFVDPVSSAWGSEAPTLMES